MILSGILNKLFDFIVVKYTPNFELAEFTYTSIFNVHNVIYYDMIYYDLGNLVYFQTLYFLRSEVNFC